MSVIDALTSELARLPGIGRKTAQRLTYYLLRQPAAQSHRLAEAIVAMRDRVRACDRCHNLTELTVCALCADPRRDGSILCVVEEASDIASIERAAEFRGLYHVLGGRLAPLDGVGPSDLTVGSLLKRIHPENVREVILALGATVDGATTMHWLADRLKPLGISVTRIAQGMPMGGALEVLDDGTLAAALRARRPS